MNKIENLVSILEILGGSGTVDEIARAYCKSKRMIMDSSYNTIITNVLMQNKDLVRYSSQLKKWQLYDGDEKEVLRVSDYKYFSKIKDVMNEVFGIFKFQPQTGYLKIDSEHRAWFPKFNNDEWENVYDESGRYWYETPKIASADYQADGMIRYVFSYDKKLGYKFTGVFKPIENRGKTRVYELIDDKVKIQPKRTPMILCRVAWMSNYKGITENDIPSGAGTYVSEHNDGYEKYNFLLREDGFYRAFVETKETKKGSGIYNRISLENIKIDGKDKDYIDGVKVVFVAPNPTTNKLTIVGWYDDATIYRERQVYNEDIFMMLCKDGNAHLISNEERNFIVPTGENAFGQSNFFYIQQKIEQKQLEKEIIEYLSKV